MAVALTLQFTDGTLVAASGSVQSGWLNTATEAELAVIRNHAGGTYQFQIEWSRDGATADITETVTTTNNGRTFIDVAAPHARITVSNTDGVNAFTTHRTTVYSR